MTATTQTGFIEIGTSEGFFLAAQLQGMTLARPMTHQFTAALVQSLGGQVERGCRRPLAAQRELGKFERTP